MRRITFLLIACSTFLLLSSRGAFADKTLLRELMEKKEVTLADGCRAIYYFRGGDENEKDIDAIVARLLEMEYIEKSYREKLDDRLRRGQFAYLLCKALDIKGGLTMRIIGTRERYALREVIFLGLMPDVNKAKYVNGMEVLGVLSRAEDYRSKKGKYRRARGGAL